MNDLSLTNITKYFKQFPKKSYSINKINDNIYELKIPTDMLCKLSGTLVMFQTGNTMLFMKLVYPYIVTTWDDEINQYALEYKEISALFYEYNGNEYEYERIRVVISPDSTYYFMRTIDNKTNINNADWAVLTRNLISTDLLIEDLNLVPSINYIRWRSTIINNLEHDEIKIVSATNW